MSDIVRFAVLLRQVTFLASAKPTLFTAVLEGIASAALAAGNGDGAAWYDDVDALFRREVGIALASLGLKQPLPPAGGDAPTPQ